MHCTTVSFPGSFAVRLVRIRETALTPFGCMTVDFSARGFLTVVSGYCKVVAEAVRQFHQICAFVLRHEVLKVHDKGVVRYNSGIVV